MPALPIQKFLEDNDLYYWSLSKRTIRGDPFTIIPPLKHIYRDPQQEVYIEKAAQVFISEYFVNLALFLADTKYAGRGNVLYIFPATPQISDFSMARIEPVITSSRYLLKRRNKVKDIEGGVTVKNVALKRIGDGYIYLRGSNRRTQIISVDADGVILDEMDEMDDGTLPAAKARTGSSTSPLYRGGSTPKYPRRGIDAVINQSDNKKWLVKCSRCNEEHDLAKVQSLIFPLPTRNKDTLLSVDPGEPELGTHFHIGSDYYVCCPNCKHVLNVWNGRWVASRTVDVSFGGYHVPKLLSNRLAFDLLAKRCEDEREGRLSEKGIQEFHNSDLGLPRAPQGAQLVLGDFIRCAEQVPSFFAFNIGSHESLYSFQSPLSATYMGVDVSPKRLHIAIIGFATHNEELRAIAPPDNIEIRPILLYASTIFTDITKLGFPELDPLLYRFNVNRTVIDTRPEAMHAREFCRRNAGKAFAAEYVPWKNKGNIIYKFDLDKRLVQMGRTETLDFTFSMVLKQQILLPVNIQSVGGNINSAGIGEFVANFMNLTKITDMEKSEAIYDDGGNPDHYAHSLNYALTAAKLSELNDEGHQYTPTSLKSTLDSVILGEYDQNVFSGLGFTSFRRDNGGRRASKSGNRRSTLISPGAKGYR